MELISKDETGAHIVRFNRDEYAALLAVVHSAALEYESLSVDVLNLSRQQVEKLEEDLFGL